MLHRLDSMLADFDEDDYRAKIDQAMHGVCTVTYRNAKGVDCRGLGFLCVIRFAGLGNVFGLMTNSSILSLKLLEATRLFCFDMNFDFADDMTQRTFTVVLQRDCETWFSDDEKHLDLSFVELRPEYQLELVGKGCQFLKIFEANIPLENREVLIFNNKTDSFVKGSVKRTLEDETVCDLRLSRLGQRATPVLDDFTFEIIGVSRADDQLRKNTATSFRQIVQKMTKSNLTLIKQSMTARRSLAASDIITAVDQSKARLAHIRDSVVIPFHTRPIICERLQRYLIMTADDLMSCSVEQLKIIFREHSIYSAIIKWQENRGHDGHYSQSFKEDKSIQMSGHEARQLVELISTRKPAPFPDFFENGVENYKRLSKKPKGTIFQAPGYIRSILSLFVVADNDGTNYNEIIIVTADGQFIGLSEEDWSQVKWQVQVAIEGADEVNILHAVYDAVADSIYLTNHRIEVPNGSIYEVKRSHLLQAAASSTDQDGSPTQHQQHGEVVHLEVLIDSAKMDGRHAWGLSVDAASRLLFVCDNGGSHNDVSVWKLPSASDQTSELIVSLRSCFIPAFCSFYIPTKQQSSLLLDDYPQNGEMAVVLAVCDWRSSSIELFAGTLDTIGVELRHLSTVAQRDTANPSRCGHVSKPCEIAFDPVGNLVIADQLNRRISVYSIDAKSKSLRNAWISRSTGFFVERFALTCNPKTGRPALLINFNYNDIAYFE